jgi:hypothetical protein
MGIPNVARRNQCRAHLATVGVATEKTRICKVPDGEFEFLGYSFGRMYSARQLLDHAFDALL